MIVKTRKKRTKPKEKITKEQSHAIKKMLNSLEKYDDNKIYDIPVLTLIRNLGTFWNIRYKRLSKDTASSVILVLEDAKKQIAATNLLKEELQKVADSICDRFNMKAIPIIVQPNVGMVGVKYIAGFYRITQHAIYIKLTKNRNNAKRILKHALGHYLYKCRVANRDKGYDRSLFMPDYHIHSIKKEGIYYMSSARKSEPRIYNPTMIHGSLFEKCYKEVGRNI